MIEYNRISSTILILLIASSFTVLGQFQYNINHQSGQDTIDQHYDSMMVDTMIRYFYITVNDSVPDYKIFNIYNADGLILWQFIYEGEPCILDRYDFSYDSIGNLLEKNRYIYPFNNPCTSLDTIKWFLADSLPVVGGIAMDDSNWIHDFKSIWKYDSKGNITYHEEYSSVDSTGSKIEYNYDINGRLISWISYKRAGTGESWANDEKGEYFYYNLGNKYSLIISEWYNWRNDWVSSRKETWDHDEQGLLISWTEFEWDLSEDEWIVEKHQQFYYDDHDKLLKYIHLDHDYWVEKRWVMGHQYEYIEHHYYDKEEHYFNDKGVDTLRLWGRFFAEIIGLSFENWECEVRGHTETDTNGYPVLQLEYQSFKRESIYSDSGVLLMEAEYEWENGEWQGKAKWEYIYTDDTLKQIHMEYNWDRQSKSWYLLHKEFYYYSEYSVKIWPVGITEPVREIQTCLVFPNPSDGYIRIEMPDQADYILGVYSVNGIKLYSERIPNGKASIDLSSLDSGLYLLILTSKETSYCNRIIIK